MWKKTIQLLGVLILLVSMIFPIGKTFAAGGIELYTPYTGISVTPGESVDYTFEVLNHSNSIKQVKLSLKDLAKGWDYSITSGGWDLKELSVKPDDSKEMTIELNVPLEVEKGEYHFEAIATTENGEKSVLPLSVTVSEKGTFKTELTSDQPNMEGDADATFSYKASLKNRTAEKQHYALTADAPRGWNVDFKVDGNSVTAVTVESNESKDIDISVTPATKVKAGTYKIPIKASTGSTSSNLTLEAAITGKYAIELTTPKGNLSADITAGDEKTIELVVKNTGTTTLTDIDLSASTPSDWEVSFDPKKIPKLEPGKSEHVQATVKASKNAIAGDYVVQMSATTPEVSSDAQFRMGVKTSLIWGWFGVIIIVAVIAGIYYLIRKYGRR